MNGRDYVLPEDVKELAPYVIAHRIIPRSTSTLKLGNSAEALVESILATVPVVTNA